MERVIERPTGISQTHRPPLTAANEVRNFSDPPATINWPEFLTLTGKGKASNDEPAKRCTELQRRRTLVTWERRTRRENERVEADLEYQYLEDDYRGVKLEQCGFARNELTGTTTMYGCVNTNIFCRHCWMQERRGEEFRVRGERDVTGRGERGVRRGEREMREICGWAESERRERGDLRLRHGIFWV